MSAQPGRHLCTSEVQQGWEDIDVLDGALHAHASGDPIAEEKEQRPDEGLREDLAMVAVEDLIERCALETLRREAIVERFTVITGDQEGHILSGRSSLNARRWR